jgi:hypothetical protein
MHGELYSYKNPGFDPSRCKCPDCSLSPEVEENSTIFGYFVKIPILNPLFTNLKIRATARFWGTIT